MCVYTLNVCVCVCVYVDLVMIRNSSSYQRQKREAILKATFEGNRAAPACEFS